MSLADFWLVVMAVSVGLFGIMVVVCTIGGFYDMRSMFRDLGAGAEVDESSEE